MTIASRTPEGEPNRCPVCQALVCIEPSHPAGDAPCPHCGVLLWFLPTSAGVSLYETQSIAALRQRIAERLAANLGISPQAAAQPSFFADIGQDSLDVAELMMELEEEFGLTIPDADAEKIRTVGDAIDYIARRQR
jgi:acyl carrier protein